MKTAQQILQQPERGLGTALPDMDEAQFRQWTALLEERTGMVLPQQRKSFLVTSLGLRMREIGCGSYQDYFQHLNAGVGGMMEWSVLVDRLTVHETRFFRHPASMELVRDQVRQKAPDPRSGKISIQAWSVACATGEEAYTLAMVIDQALRERGQGGYLGVTATDISSPALAIARQGIYGERRMKDIPAELRDEYLQRLEDGRYQVVGALRKRVCCARMNILEAAREPLGKMDIVYCQNLLIYFERARREYIVADMVEHLLPGGILILGSGELVGWKHPLMEKLNCGHTLAYRRRTTAA